MPNSNTSYTDIRARILYHVAKAAWEGRLTNSLNNLHETINEEFSQQLNRRQIVNQIRAAMGLPPHDSDSITDEYDEEALLGLDSSPIFITDAAACKGCQDRTCESQCPARALKHNDDGHLTHDSSNCLYDGKCLLFCPIGALAEKSEIVALINLLQQRHTPVYASVAPAFAGQFGLDVTAGKLRSALLLLGFAEMVETALAADFTTLKEAFEFEEHVQNTSQFMITSCCCPAWIKLIENKYPDLTSHISPSVSPMIASARIIKAYQPNAKVVFIGPCIAKKAEAKLPDLKGDVDFVLTFQELQTVFQAANIKLADMPDEENAIASWGGRMYGRAGGVSQAVETTLKRILPGPAQIFKAAQADGIPACMKMLNDRLIGASSANFLEGMACQGGCVGGPGRLLPPPQGADLVDAYSNLSAVKTPAENPQVYAILAKFGQGQQLTQLTGQGSIGQLLHRQLTKLE